MSTITGWSSHSGKVFISGLIRGALRRGSEGRVEGLREFSDPCQEKTRRDVSFGYLPRSIFLFRSPAILHLTLQSLLKIFATKGASMKRFFVFIALLCASTFAAAQKADAAFVVGGSFVSDTNGTVLTVPTTIHTDHHIFLEGALGVRLLNAHLVS